MVEYLEMETLPRLRQPIFLAAFEGWNDASEVATGALRSLVRRWSGSAFARIDPEEFFDFTESRPLVSYDAEGQRSLKWPETTFWACKHAHRDHDFVVLIGTEPQLRWRTFAQTILSLVEQANISLVVIVGGLLADVAHTSRPVVTGSATRPDLRSRILHQGVSATRYQGPTGIVGVLQDACRRRQVPAASIWGSVPHYLRGTVPNPPVQTAILHYINDLLDLGLDLSVQDRESSQFRHQVDEAVAGNQALLEHIRELEGRGEQETTAHDTTEPPLPSGEEFVRQLEEFLRRQNRQEGEEQ